jgi:hypothetical protein
MTRQRMAGMRALIDFAPKPASDERLFAGAVFRNDEGEIAYTVAVSQRNMQHAFGDVGQALHDVALRLCKSLAEHWASGKDPRQWVPPFNNARLAAYERFSAYNLESAGRVILARMSTLYTLDQAYLHEASTRAGGIVEKVRAAVKRDPNAKHLANRFHRNLTINGEAQPLRVDFLGQNYACYILQVTHSARGLDMTTDRAYGKLFELGALRRMLSQPQQHLGLLEDERPQRYELLMVGDRNNAVQRKAIFQVEALAEKNEVQARIEPNAISAAERVYHQEKQAA